jgi:aminoglycoside phosphotransferase (APT) family kinase protein
VTRGGWPPHNVVVFVDVHEVLAANDLEASGCLDGIQVLQQRPGRLVARVDTVTGPVVIKASAQPGAFVTEEAAIHRLAGHGLPVASVIGHRVGPPSYLVLTWTDGSSLTARSPARAQRTFGELLRRVHTIGAEPGRDDLSFPDNTTWDGWMTGWLNTALTWWSSVDPLGERRTRQAWDWFHRLAPLLANRGQDLILFDGRPEHILVRDDDIAGLIDVAELRTGDAAMDLGVLAVADPAILTEVLAGYRPSDDERDAFSRLVPFYTFLRAISSAVWHQSFGTADELTRALHRIASMDIPA